MPVFNPLEEMQKCGQGGKIEVGLPVFVASEAWRHKHGNMLQVAFRKSFHTEHLTGAIIVHLNPILTNNELG